MKFSFVIPTYNSAATLARAVSSVLRQRRVQDEIEIILVDDGSTDETLQISTDLAKQNHFMMLLKTTSSASGPGVARNLGIAAARGTWTLFIDSDDELADGGLDELRRMADSPENTAADIIAFNWRYAPWPRDGAIKAGEGREDLTLLAANNMQEMIRAYLGSRIDQSSIYHAYRTEFLRINNSYFRGGYHEDVDFTFRGLLSAQRTAATTYPVYAKWDRGGSIVNTFSRKHVQGYFDAIAEIFESLKKVDASNFLPDFKEFIVSVTASRLARLIRDDVSKQDATEAILETLRERLQQSLALLPNDVGFPASSLLETRHHKALKLFQGWGDGRRDSHSTEGLIADLRALQTKSWSCYDIHHSAFLAPEEIRTCCKRYHHKGKMMGDVVLLHGDTSGETQFTYQDILAAKIRLHREINRNNAPECEGCPFLTFDDWGAPLSDGVKYLSLEYHSICNMRCTYCSPTYYGGKDASYDVTTLISSIGNAGALKANEYVVWGGGEPGIDKRFPTLAKKLGAFAPKVKQRVITNCTRYSAEIADMMANDQAYIVVSLDAGTQPTFQKMRGYKSLERVVRNIARYVTAAPQNVIIKYIVTPENLSSDELTSFLELAANANLLAANFQVSCDFRAETLSWDEIRAIAALACELLSRIEGHLLVDDLVWQRLPYVTADLYRTVRTYLEQQSLSHLLADPADYPEIAVWGTGAHARLLIEKSHLLRSARVPMFIDPRPSAIGGTLHGAPICAPDALLESKLPVMIGAVQSAPTIYTSIRGMGIAEKRIVKKLVI